MGIILFLCLLALTCFAALACFAGCHGLRAVTPASHGPLVAMSSAIGSIIIVGALAGTAESSGGLAKYLGLAAIMLASVTIVGSLVLIERLLAANRKNGRE